MKMTGSPRSDQANLHEQFNGGKTGLETLYDLLEKNDGQPVADAELEKTTAKFNLNKSDELTCTGEVLKFDGF